MGLAPSPYQAVQGMMVAEDVNKGDHLDAKNLFCWDTVQMNLPGSKTYDPALPWVSKVRFGNNNIACDLVIFVDDLRVTGPTSVECWNAGQRAAQVLTHLGLQDAPRKRRGASQAPAPWTGTILRTDLKVVFVFVVQDKWDKAKAEIEEVIEMVERDPERLDYKCLEQAWGVLQHVTQTYSGMTRYIIGFHLTIDGWQANRMASGWRMKMVPSAKSALSNQGGGGIREELVHMEGAHGESEETLGLSSTTQADTPKFVKAARDFYQT
jgi:hypothetical protein